jgi:histidinol-phosphate aminotransferase
MNVFAAPAGAELADPAPGLALIKPAVRAQAAYTLAAPAPRRKLNQNESPYDLPAELKRKVLDCVAQAPWQRYPEFVPRALVERLSAHYDWPADGILVGNGSNELIQATLSVTLEAGDRVVAPAPTFSLYRLLTNVLGGRYVPVPLAPDFTYDVERLIDVAVAERARVVVLNSPNNPTGSALPEGAVERVLRATGALVLCDEAYQDFGGPSAHDALRSSSRVVVLRTFSKALGLAGLRFGVSLSHPALAREIAKAKLPYNVNLVTLAAAEVALEHAAIGAARVRDIMATRDRSFERLLPDPLPRAAGFGALSPALRRVRHPDPRRVGGRRAGRLRAHLGGHRRGHGRRRRRPGRNAGRRMSRRRSPCQRRRCPCPG